METLVINIPEKKSALVKQLLKELGVTIDAKATVKSAKTTKPPNPLTAQTIDDAHNGVGLSEPIKDINAFMKSL
ncbi:MAG TPA: hypothetical protein VHS53_06205 [Mucilaginibacter sp.]|nr:hypothetical protein [Mucilaginibacter sp.]